MMITSLHRTRVAVSRAVRPAVALSRRRRARSRRSGTRRRPGCTAWKTSWKPKTPRGRVRPARAVDEPAERVDAPRRRAMSTNGDDAGVVQQLAAARTPRPSRARCSTARTASAARTARPSAAPRRRRRRPRRGQHGDRRGRRERQHGDRGVRPGDEHEDHRVVEASSSPRVRAAPRGGGGTARRSRTAASPRRVDRRRGGAGPPRSAAATATSAAPLPIETSAAQVCSQPAQPRLELGDGVRGAAGGTCADAGTR